MLRSLKAKILEKEISLRSGGKAEISEEQVVEVLVKAAKQRRESIDQFEKGGREDLAQTERAELEIIESYLPAQMGEEEIRAAERQLEQAKLQHSSAKINRSTDTVNTDTAIEQALLNVQKAEIELENTVLRSPINGTILSVAGHVGERIGSGIFVTVANLDQPLVEIFIDETDLNKRLV